MTLIHHLLLCCWLRNQSSSDEVFEACLFRRDRSEVVQVLARYHHTLSSVSKLHRSSDGCTLLFVASGAGDWTLVELLLLEEEQEQGNDSSGTGIHHHPHHHTDPHGNTPLIGACLGGHATVAKALVKAYPEWITQANHQGTTPIMAAAWRGHLELVQYLWLLAKQQQEQQQQPNSTVVLKHVLTEQQDHLGRTAKDLAKEWGHSKVVEWIDDNNTVF